MRPRHFQLLGNELAVLWEDGHESYYPAEMLRRGCPCAVCSGEPDLFGRVSGGGEVRHTPQSFDLVSVDAVGNYAIQPNWADGHTWGLWTFDRLRELCPCEICRAQP